MKTLFIFLAMLLPIVSYAWGPGCEDYGRSEEDCYRSSGPFDEFMGDTFCEYEFSAFIEGIFQSSEPSNSSRLVN